MSGVGTDLVTQAYDGLARVLRDVDEPASWRPTGCRGWAVRDLTHHLLSDAQRALVALHSPTDEPPDVDAVTYWSGWGEDPVGDANGRRATRVAATMFTRWEQLRDLYLDTARGVCHAAAGAGGAEPVRTQGHVLTTDDLLRTLAVEATVHHLDLVTDLPQAPRPTSAGLAEVRRVLDALAGRPASMRWADERWALVGTGRAIPDAAERDDLGPVADRLPLFA